MSLPNKIQSPLRDASTKYLLTLLLIVQLARWPSQLRGQETKAEEPAARDATTSDNTLTSSQDLASLDELLLFFPAKYPAGDWSPKNLNYQDVHFESQDGTKLHGWYCPVSNPKAVLLIAHGNAGNIASRAEWLRYLQQQAHVSTLMFDYRGYGRSEGSPTVKGILQDAQAAQKKLCELASVNEVELVLMGESLGGAVVVQLVNDFKPRGLILQSTFSSLYDIARVHYPRLAWLVPRNKLDSASVLPSYHGSSLISHGTRDRTIPFACGQKLFEAANQPKLFVPIPNADHNDWLTSEYLRQLDTFLSSLPSSK